MRKKNFFFLIRFIILNPYINHHLIRRINEFDRALLSNIPPLGKPYEKDRTTSEKERKFARRLVTVVGSVVRLCGVIEIMRP